VCQDFRIGPGSVMNAISRMSPPHAGHSRGNSSPTRAMSLAFCVGRCRGSGALHACRSNPQHRARSRHERCSRLFGCEGCFGMVRGESCMLGHLAKPHLAGRMPRSTYAAALTACGSTFVPRDTAASEALKTVIHYRRGCQRQPAGLLHSR
jgi:hypothetical protein